MILSRASGLLAVDHPARRAKLGGELATRIGVLILLFEVGLESTVAQMLKVGLSSLLVATLGVVTPFALGWGVGAWLLPEQGIYVHAFLAPRSRLRA